ncbi:MAG: stalk domain-containing protein [Armatimonadota bacterium]
MKWPIVKPVIFCILIVFTGISAFGQVTSGSDGWVPVGSDKMLPLRALMSYAGGKCIHNGNQLICTIGKQELKLRIASKNIFLDGQIKQLDCETTEIDGITYVADSISHAIGWTYIPTTTGFVLHNPSLKKSLVITRRRWSVEPIAGSDATKKVGVWYITSFYPKGQGPYHWDDVVARGADMPLGGPYILSDPDVIKRQISQMHECGIDFILMDDTNTVWVDNSLVDKNIRAWFDYMDKLPGDERIPIAIASGGELNQHTDKNSWLKAVDYLYDTYAKRPSYLYENGKPVLHWYIEKDVWPEWHDERWNIRRTYHFFRTQDQVANGGWGYGSDEYPRCIKECLSFHPGWNLSPPGHKRESGDFYRQRWMNALRCEPEHVLLSDWNGWNEGTALEDSNSWKDTYGDTAPPWYRLLTQGYVAAYNGNLVDGFYYRDESQPHIVLWTNGELEPQSEYPHKIPVISLPSGMLDRLARSNLSK